MQASTTPPIFTPTLVGRAGQLETLRGLIDLAKRGEGHVALVSGEAGIGKSRLVVEAKTFATTQGFLVLQGNCFSADVSYPYAPLLDLLRSFFASPLKETPATELETLARNIFPLLPEFVADQSIPVPRLDPEQEKRRLFAVLVNFFIHLLSQSPVLLIIEDVHWSDDTSLDFLHTLVRRIVSQQFLLVVTYRHDEISPSLGNWLTQIDRTRITQEMRLAPLSRGEVDTMLSAIFDSRHTALDMRRFVHGELLDTLYTLTEGNPFFVEETLTSLIAAGDIFYVQGYWNRASQRAIHVPRSVQDGVYRRTQHLSEVARHVLTLAAVAGRHFDFALLQQLTDFDEHQLLQVMKELVSAQLVIEESGERFAFRHALTRQAIYTQLLIRERTLLHRTIAETLEKLSSTSIERELEDLAYHYYQARAWQKTVDYAYRAGEKALQLYSHRAAIDYFTWTLEAVDQFSISPEVPAFYRARGQAYETLGEFEHAQQDYTRALEAAHSLNDRHAEWQSAIDLGFLWAGRDYAKTESWFRQALDLAQALDDPALQARSLNRVGNWHLNVEQPGEALRYHKEALSIFEQLNDEHGIAETLDLMGMTSYLGGDLIQGTTYYKQAIELFRKTGNRQGLASGLATLPMRGPTFHSDVMVAAGSLAEAQQDAESALKIAREIGHRSAEAYALFQLGLCLGSQGEYGRALKMTQQSLDVADEIEHRQWQAAAHAMLGGVYSGLLALPQAREHFEQALALAQEVGSLFWMRMVSGYLASAAILLHDLDLAEKVLQAVLSPDTPAQTLGQRMAWCANVELELARGDPARALGILDQLVASGAHAEEAGRPQGSRLAYEAEEARRPQGSRLAYEAEEARRAQGLRLPSQIEEARRAQGLRLAYEAEQTGRPQGSPLPYTDFRGRFTYGLRILKLRGEALAAAKRPEEAEDAFVKAQVIARELGARPMLWRICVAMGNLYFAQGRNAEAEQEFVTARMLIEELVATIEDEPMRDNFLRLSMAMLPQTRPLSPKHVAKQAFGGLTAREREVAVLIARGKSNQEIADRLIVTKRTVETHVGNIMFKSGCTSRTQIAVWVIEMGLAERVEE
jgi:DNA-binding CsgD family transcriptional regulator/tetratricopeptide (TPR) repeat protein